MAKPKPKLPKPMRPTCCVLCEEPRPRGVLPHAWDVHPVADASVEGGVRNVLTCSDACRLFGGYEERDR